MLAEQTIELVALPRHRGGVALVRERRCDARRRWRRAAGSLQRSSVRSAASRPCRVGLSVASASPSLVRPPGKAVGAPYPRRASASASASCGVSKPVALEHREVVRLLTAARREVAADHEAARAAAHAEVLESLGASPLAAAREPHDRLPGSATRAIATKRNASTGSMRERSPNGVPGCGIRKLIGTSTGPSACSETQEVDAVLERLAHADDARRCRARGRAPSRACTFPSARRTCASSRSPGSGGATSRGCG